MSDVRRRYEYTGNMLEAEFRRRLFENSLPVRNSSVEGWSVDDFGRTQAEVDSSKVSDDPYPDD